MMNARNARHGCGLLAVALLGIGSLAAQNMHYEPTLESLNKHPLPQWYADAKLGIFVHWGLYSVPGWAEVNRPKVVPHEDEAKWNAYAEWYYNTMRIAGSPTQAYHREHYGANFNYYDFAPIFDRETKKWDPGVMAAAFRDAGARYVVLTSKHHEGFTLWPSKVVNPNQQHLQAQRDIVGELTEAVQHDGMKMGLYYSGGYDWTFNRGPIIGGNDWETVKPESIAYGQYAFDQIEELIAKYHPAVLWDDIDWPKTGKPLQVMADYYNALPDGVVDDRFGVKHSDFQSPEYEKRSQISKVKWEECRGLGRSFGYNRAEGEKETIAPDELIYLLADIVSKNGNLLLDVGPEADGTIPPIQMDRLKSLGAWLHQNGDAIYGTEPWSRAEGETDQNVPVRFTQKGGHLYATLMGSPKSGAILLRNVRAASGSQMQLLGDAKPLAWTQKGADLEVQLPATLPGKYAYVLRMEPAS
jgi:alpha-L-fucosidase